MVIGRLPRRCLASLLSSPLSFSSLRSAIFPIQSNNASSSKSSPPTSSTSPSTASSPLPLSSHCCKCAAITISSMKKQEEEMLKMVDVMCENTRTMMKQYVMDMMQHHHDEMSAMMKKQMEEGEKMIAARKEEMMKRVKENKIGVAVDVSVAGNGNGNGDVRKSEGEKEDSCGLEKQNEGRGEAKSKKKLPPFISTDYRLKCSSWSHNGNTIYYVHESNLVEIDIDSSKVVRTVHEDNDHDLRSIALSKSGDIYLTDWNSKNMYVISPISGEIIRTIKCREGRWDGRLYSPFGICVVDEWKEVFVCNARDDRIQVFSMDDGHFIRKFGTRGDDPGELDGPKGVAVDASAGLVFVSDQGNHRIQVFDRYGELIRMFGSEGSGDGKFDHPCGLVADAVTKQIIVCDYSNDRLCRFDYDGNFKASIKAENMRWPSSISMNSDRQLTVSASYDKVFFFDDGIWSDDSNK